MLQKRRSSNKVAIIVLVNSTPYKWKLTESKHTLNEWTFRHDAGTIKSYTTATVSVVADVESGEEDDDIKATATYEIEGTDSSFQVFYRSQNVHVCNVDIETNNAKRGSEFPLGDNITDGKRPVYWYILSGTKTDFYSVGKVDSWMQDNFSLLKNRTLRQTCIPSSHDSAMFAISEKTTLAPKGSILTQKQDIGGQLALGVRDFDIRPVLGPNHQWYVGHWSFVDKLFLRWQGGNGPSLKSIIDDINAFTDSHQELVVLKLSHDNTFCDTGGNEMQLLTDDQWTLLLKFLCSKHGLRNRWKSSTSSLNSTDTDQDLTKIKLKDFIDGKSSVIVIVKNGIDTTDFDGCFNYTSWPWDSSPWEGEESDRLKTFCEAAAASDANPYLYSGCHTPSASESVKTKLEELVSGWTPPFGTSSSVLNKADAVANRFFVELFNSCTSEIYPAGLSADGIGSSYLTALAVAFSKRSTK